MTSFPWLVRGGPSTRPAWRPPARRALVALLAVALMPFGLISSVAAQNTPRTVEVTGRGWGHGRGMGQYGAYGYATDHGWSSGQILNHFYGGTTAGQAPAGGPVDRNQVRVELRFMRDRPTTIGLGGGTILLRGLDGADLGQVGAGAVRLQWTGNSFQVQTASSCSGTFSNHSTISGRTTVRLVASSTTPGADGKLHACGPSYRSWYEGEMRAVVDGGAARTVNVVTIEQYLRGVVPNEVPAFWPSAALEAQAVAARSYALAGDSRQLPYADTCDSTLCQVYDGLYTERGSGFHQATHFRTDAAVAATSGVVRLRSNGTVARTEFSSSTGGYTAGGDFPAVIDAGDSTSLNPNRTWTATVEVAPIESRFGRGRLLAIVVVGRNGLGADGGRVTSVEYRFEQGTVTETGTAARTTLGLKSDWFTPGPVVGGDPRATPTGIYIDRVYQTLGGRSASDAEITQWYDTVNAGNRRALTDQLVLSDFFAGEMIDDLYLRALGRSADPGGRAYWLDQMARGLKLGKLGVYFYGSAEYYARGGTNQQFVIALYRDILGRTPDPGGQQYWTALLDNRRANLDDVAAGFYISLESRRQRAYALHQRLLGPVASPAVGDALANRLLSVDDLALAAEIMASQEAYNLYSVR